MEPCFRRFHLSRVGCTKPFGNLKVLKDVEVYKGEELYKGVSICEEIKTLAEEPRKKNTDDSNITHRVRGSEKSSENPKVFWSYM